MEYRIKAIETEYKGILFRSRLEAKWAAFFDQCGWRWEYEPFDLPGWIPDFQIEGKILVEVKPFPFSGEITDSRPWIEEMTKINKALHLGDSSSEVLLCGTNPLTKLHSSSLGNLLAWPRKQCPHARPICIEGGFDICERHSPRGVFTGKNAISKMATTAMWANACNATRWEKRR